MPMKRLGAQAPVMSSAVALSAETDRAAIYRAIFAACFGILPTMPPHLPHPMAIMIRKSRVSTAGRPLYFAAARVIAYSAKIVLYPLWM